MITVTQHAIDRYIERVANVSRVEAEARIRLSEKTIGIAASIGCGCVRVSKHVRYVLDGAAVVSVFGPGMFPRCTRRGGEA